MLLTLVLKDKASNLNNTYVINLEVQYTKDGLSENLTFTPNITFEEGEVVDEVNCDDEYQDLDQQEAQRLKCENITLEEVEEYCFDKIGNLVECEEKPCVDEEGRELDPEECEETLEEDEEKDDDVTKEEDADSKAFSTYKEEWEDAEFKEGEELDPETLKKLEEAKKEELKNDVLSMIDLETESWSDDEEFDESLTEGEDYDAEDEEAMERAEAVDREKEQRQ